MRAAGARATGGSGAPTARSSRSMSRRRLPRPSPRAAEMPTTGTPSWRSSALSSITRPARAPTSIMLSASTSGAAQLDDLQREVQVAVEVGGVDHEHDQVGRRRVLLQAEQHVAHDALVGRGAAAGCRLPGRSMISTRVPPGSSHEPVFFSTVTPG